MLNAVSRPANARPHGINDCFVIIRVTTRPDGAIEMAAYVNAVLLAPIQRLESILESYRIGQP